MHDVLIALEQSALGVWMRTSSLWVYPIVNLLHIFGIATLFGATTIIDLRLVGLWRRIPLAAVAQTTVPMATGGFFLAAPTGIALLATKATEYDGNPFLLLKFAAIAIGLVNVAALNAVPAWRSRRVRDLTAAEERGLALYGGLSLAAWTTAVAAGRLIAYY